MAEITNGLFSILSVTVGGLIGYCSAIRTAIRKEKIEATLEFQGVFYKTLYKIDPRYKMTTEKVDAYEILKKDFEGHVLAVMKFRQYVPKGKLVDFDAVWTNYHTYEIAPGHYFYVDFDKYKLDDGDPRYSIDIDLIIKNINQILSFAKINHSPPFWPEPIEDRKNKLKTRTCTK